MLSVDCDKKVVMKGIDHGASDFMVKPVRTHELKNIWQHVQRWRNPKAIIHISDHDNDVQRVQPATTDKSKYSGNKRNVGDDSSENNEGTHISAIHRKPRMTWTIELHNKFLEAINQIGLDSKNSHLVPHSSTMLTAPYFHYNFLLHNCRGCSKKGIGADECGLPQQREYRESSTGLFSTFMLNFYVLLLLFIV